MQSWHWNVTQIRSDWLLDYEISISKDELSVIRLVYTEYI